MNGHKKETIRLDDTLYHSKNNKGSHFDMQNAT